MKQDGDFVPVPILTAAGLRKLAQGIRQGEDRLDVLLAPGEAISCHFWECCVGGGVVRAEWVQPDSFNLILTALMPENRLALLVSEATGLRIGDVLKLRPSDLRSQRPFIKEQKTGKTRRVYLPTALWREMQQIAGQFYVFEGRTDSRKHRTRQAVYKDLRRVAALYRLDGRKIEAHLSPHSARKIFAVEVAKSRGVAGVQKEFKHVSEAVAMVYAMADVLTEKNHPQRRQKT